MILEAMRRVQSAPRPLEDLRLRHAPLRRFLLGRGVALILNLAPVEALSRMVAERSFKSSGPPWPAMDAGVTERLS
jgi:hypothetical protein